jgi:hypothetical protein
MLGSGSSGPENTEILYPPACLRGRFSRGAGPSVEGSHAVQRSLAEAKSRVPLARLLSIMIPPWVLPVLLPSSVLPFAVWWSGSHRIASATLTFFGTARKRNSRRCTLGRIGQTRQWYVHPQTCARFGVTRFLTQCHRFLVPHLIQPCSRSLAARTHSFWVWVPIGASISRSF